MNRLSCRYATKREHTRFRFVVFHTNYYLADRQENNDVDQNEHHRPFALGFGQLEKTRGQDPEV
jgi:hypothetical protein